MTYSIPQSTNSPLPARKRASQARPKTAGKPTRNGTTRRPSKPIPAPATIRNPIPT